MRLADNAHLQDRKPFFLVGPLRSGSTLLRLLLGHHPDICRCEELEFVATPLDLNQGPPQVSDYHRYLDLNRNFRMSGYKYDPALKFADQARDFLKQRQKLDGKPIVGATVHNHFNRLPEIWPEAKYIFLTRDPRDVARSCVDMGWTGSAWGGAQVWIDAYRQWQALAVVIPENRRIEVRFEDLMSNTIGVLEELCEFLGTTYDPEMLEIERDTTYRRPNPNAARSWRDSATPTEIQQVEARIGPATMTTAGYELSGHPPMAKTSVSLLSIKLQDVFVRVNFRIRRYGMGLWMAGVVSRRLPLRIWRERTQLKIDDVDNQHMK